MTSAAERICVKHGLGERQRHVQDDQPQIQLRPIAALHAVDQKHEGEGEDERYEGQRVTVHVEFRSDGQA